MRLGLEERENLRPEERSDDGRLHSALSYRKELGLEAARGNGDTRYGKARGGTIRAVDEKSPGYTCCLEQPIPDTDTLTTVYFPWRSTLLLQKHNLSKLVCVCSFLE